MLAFITVGDLERYTNHERRLALYNDSSRSWFSKNSTGEANGFEIKELDLPAATTTDELLGVLYSVQDYVGFQLMWPLPEHVDSAAVYNAVDVRRDVDGIHYVGQCGIGNARIYAPVTLLTEHGVALKSKRVLVVGRSPVVGAPIAHLLRDRHDAVVTVVHAGNMLSTIQTQHGRI